MGSWNDSTYCSVIARRSTRGRCYLHPPVISLQGHIEGSKLTQTEKSVLRHTRRRTRIYPVDVLTRSQWHQVKSGDQRTVQPGGWGRPGSAVRPHKTPQTQDPVQQGHGIQQVEAVDPRGQCSSADQAGSRLRQASYRRVYVHYFFGSTNVSCFLSVCL